MEATINNPQTFPVGTTVKAYPESNWTKSKLPPVGAPPGAAAAEAVVAANGAITFVGLTEQKYFATAEVGGAYRYVKFFPQAAATTAQTVKAEVQAVKEAAEKALDFVARKGLRIKEYFSPSVPFGWSSYEGVANTAAFSRFVPHRAMSIRGVSFFVSTAAAQNDKCAIAVYDENGNKLAVSAETAGLLNATGRKEIDLTADLALEAEKEYWVGLQYGAAGGAVAKFSGMVFSTAGQSRMISGVVPEANKFNGAIIATALPTFPFATALGAITAVAAAPVLIVRER